MKLHLTALVAAVALAAGAANAKTFKWTSSSDIPTWDIHSQNNALANGIHAAVYESLVYYNSKTFKPEPVLATSWKQVSPTQLRMTLRKGVKFHDGSELTADDAVFSLQRAMAKTSNFAVYAAGIDRVVKVDDLTFDIFTKDPNPVLLNQLTELRIMSKAWAEKNKSVEPKDIKTQDENFAHRNANGTGPFVLKEWQPDQKLVLSRNPNWWGKSETNVTEVVYTPVKNVATRMAALLSGEVDFVLDPSPQDLPRIRQNSALKVIDGVENRTIFFGMDQFRDELPGSNIKGKNPLKDQRVRKALYQAIDMNTIARVTLRGLGQPTGALVAPQVNGWTEAVHKRYPFDAAAAQKLLVTYFPMIQRYEASIYMLGWGVPTFDAMYSLQSLTRSVGAGGDGNYNVGRYSNPQMDGLIERAKKETDLKLRTELLTKALQLQNDDVAHIPLHNQVIPWAMKKNIDVVHRADNRLDWRLIKVN